MAYKDPKDQAAASKRHYEANKEKIIKRSRKRNIRQRDKNRLYVESIKKQSGCVDCGESDPRVLDFDHINTKRHNISTLLRKEYSWDSILEEASNCVVRCANCHRIKTAIEQNHYTHRLLDS